ncbi:uncharacterized protein LOC116945756 isoform X3 [Petromyzon marinus]|uniref:uncharacterized protein LOC116945756 isoform X3 n=1 Tax=Petromyzon marinus TaxID=7757 RepID=UPI003F720F66
MSSPDLPVEVITRIMSLLSVAERREASLVNKAWYQSSLDHTLQKDVVYNLAVGCGGELGWADAWSASGMPSRASVSAVLTCTDGSHAARQALELAARRLGPSLEQLALRGAALQEAILPAVLQHCPRLLSLDLTGCDGLFMPGMLLGRPEECELARPGLRNLQRLSLAGLRYLSDSTFNRLVSLTPHLSHLSLAGCHMTFDFYPYSSHNGRKDADPSGRPQDSTAMLLLRNLLSFLQQHADTLTGLDLSGLGLTMQTACAIVGVPGLHLTSFLLRDCKDLSDAAVQAIVTAQPFLEVLDVSGCTLLTDKAALAVSLGLPGLRRLGMGHLRHLTDAGLSGLACLPRLTALSVPECHQLTGKDLWDKGSCKRDGASVMAGERPQLRAEAEGGQGTALAPLQELSLRYCNIAASSVVSLAVALGASLRELDLSSCVAVTDASVRAISTSLATLRVLRLAWCRELTDWGLLGIERPCLQPLLPSSHTSSSGPKFSRSFGNIGFFSPPPVWPVGLAPPSPAEVEAGEVGPRLSALTQLAELDLANCFRVTDASLTQVLRFPELRCLHVSHLCELSDAALLALSRGCPSLERLSLAGCYRLSDGGLAAAAPLLRRLRHLDLSRCEQVSDSVLDALAGSCPWLRSLDVSRCSRITLEAVERLQAALPELGDVHMRSANGQDLAYAL